MPGSTMTGMDATDARRGTGTGSATGTNTVRVKTKGVPCSTGGRSRTVPSSSTAPRPAVPFSTQRSFTADHNLSVLVVDLDAPDALLGVGPQGALHDVERESLQLSDATGLHRVSGSYSKHAQAMVRQKISARTFGMISSYTTSSLSLETCTSSRTWRLLHKPHNNNNSAAATALRATE